MTDSSPSDRRVDARRADRLAWLDRVLAERGERALGPATPLTADASFRRFERVPTDVGSRILMDAPPATERNAEFIAIAAWLEQSGLQAPKVLAADPERGFLLVTDLGDLTLERALRVGNPAQQLQLYRRAIDTLIALQAAARVHPPPFASYDRARLDLENGLFGSWFIEGLLGLDAPRSLLDPLFATLTRAHLGAPRAGVHLDWHCRNLLVLDGTLGNRTEDRTDGRTGGSPDDRADGRTDDRTDRRLDSEGSGDDRGSANGRIGIVDFQDARIGPVCYDLVSLLRDCYQPPSAARVAAGVEHYLHGARAAGIEGTDDREAFLRAFDLIGMQRHLKAIGIFARLHLRDGRDHALADIPNTLEHLLAVAPGYPQTRPLAAWLSDTVTPALQRWQAGRRT